MIERIPHITEKNLKKKSLEEIFLQHLRRITTGNISIVPKTFEEKEKIFLSWPARRSKVASSNQNPNFPKL